MVTCHELLGNQMILYGELAPIVWAINIRLHQEEFKKHDQAPILMLSLVGPKHGRLLHASLDDDGALVIRCSGYYSFERLADAPFDLFCRYFLSTPVGETFTLRGC
ncbi:hypothetical protein VTN77DRAFT_1521 [Rasamsonia byssochlamydoides]|uniref:uncharacterized protein n=1 Tax=Rasamsonia byssochlamydoides TaxID=89139 RepID=UPI0037430E63